MRTTLFAIILLQLPLLVAAQAEVSISSFAFSDGVHPTFSFQFEGTDVRYVESWWKDELKRVSREVSNKKEVVGAAALLPQIASDTVRVLVKAEQRKGAPYLVAHVAVLTREGWVGPSSDARAFEGARNYVRQQSTLLRHQLVQQELTAAEKGLARLNTELNGMQREKERAEAGIEKSKQRGTEAIQEQERLEKEQVEMAAKVEAQRKENAAGTTAEGEKALAELLKQQARLQEKRRKAGDDELQAKKKAEELAWAIKKNVEDQARKRSEITRQEQLVKALREKRDSIR